MTGASWQQQRRRTEAHRVARRGLAAAVWAVTCVLWAVAVPRTSWALAVEAADVDTSSPVATIAARVRRHLRATRPGGLRLPFADLAVLVEARCYGVDPWDDATREVHGGIDLIPQHTDLGPGERRKVEPEMSKVDKLGAEEAA